MQPTFFYARKFKYSHWNQQFYIFGGTLDRYASAPRDLRTDWDKFTKDYFLNRPTLVSVFLLIDASIPTKPIDLEYARWLGQNQVFVFTSVSQENLVLSEFFLLSMQFPCI